jgi:hypothetical protein
METVTDHLAKTVYFLLLPAVSIVACVFWARTRSPGSLLIFVGLTAAVIGWAMPLFVPPNFEALPEDRKFMAVEYLSSNLFSLGSIVALIGFGRLAIKSPKAG